MIKNTTMFLLIVYSVLNITDNGTGIYAVPDAETLKFSRNLNRVLHIYLVSSSYLYEISRISNKIDNFM